MRIDTYTHISLRYGGWYLQKTCAALPGEGKKMDPAISAGLKWLLTMICKDYEELHRRVTEDMEEQRKREAEEKKARRERVRKMKEER